MNEATIPDLHAEMQAVIANLEAREWIQWIEVDDGKVCAHGAVKTCEALRPGDEQIIRAVMRRRGVTEAWNDEGGRTKGEVLTRMRQIEVTDDDLEVTFGPTWRLVVAVIRRAAALTPDEAQQLSAARDAASDAAMGAAWDAATAAVVADLVGQYGLTQNHIDTLMKPWTDTLGQNWAEGIKS